MSKQQNQPVSNHQNNPVNPQAPFSNSAGK
jgi:hypothetical protein